MASRRKAPVPHVESEVVSALLGLLAIGTAVVLVMASFALFRHSFTSTKSLTLQADRAGLLMSTGGAVKLRGVRIGTVSEVRNDSGGAELKLAIDSKYLKAIPSNVGAKIVPTTVFGNKYVELTTPARPGPAIQAGSIVMAKHVTVEINNTFESLVTLLDGVKPRQINAALTSLATALQGNGEQAGQFIEVLNTYLGDINPELPQFNADLTQGVSVANQYADLAPALVRLAANGTSISDTLVANRASLDALLVSFTRLADTTGGLVSANESNLTASLAALSPTTRLLQTYASELPCVIEGLAVNSDLENPTFGAKEQPGVNGYVGFLPAQDPYQYSRDLPQILARNAPTCNGLPNVTRGTVPPHPHVPSGGVDPYEGDVAGGGIAGDKDGLPKTYLNMLLGTFSGLAGLGGVQ